MITMTYALIILFGLQLMFFFLHSLKGSIFKIPRVRTFFNIPQLIAYELPKKPKKKQSIVQNAKGGKEERFLPFL